MSEDARAAQFAHEATFSINIALVVAAAFLVVGPQRATAPLFRLDRIISQRVGLVPDLRGTKAVKDYFTPGYFAFFGLVIVVSLSLLCLLWLFAKSMVVREFLRSAAGISALVCAPLAWLWFNGWGHFVALLETALIVVFGIIYLLRARGSSADFTGIIILVLHYGFWFYTFGAFLSFGGYYGPLPPTVGLCAGLAWLMYLRQLRCSKDVG